MVRRSCSGGNKRVLFTMSCWNLVIPLRAIGIGYNWFVWAVHWREKRLEYEQRHDKVILLHDNAHIDKVVKKYLENAQMGCFTTPAIFSGYCSFWLLVWFRRMQQVIGSLLSEIENWLQNWMTSKDESFFRGWNSIIAWEMGKSSRQRWIIL